MCLSIPGKVVSIDETITELKMGKVNFAGVGKDVCLQWLDDVKVGDFVIVHVGFALSKVDEKEALSTIEMLREMGDLVDESKEIE
jgi:hydrogenase expression/formation protein HypC